MQILFPSTFFCALAFISAKTFKTEKDIEQYFRTTHEKNSNVRCGRFKTALWNAQTDSDDANKQNTLRDVAVAQAQAVRKEWTENLKNFTAKTNWSEKSKRQIAAAKRIGFNILRAEDYKNLTDVLNNVTVIFQSVKLCPFNKKKCKKAEMLSFEKDLRKKMQESIDSEELLYIWTGWRDLIGADVKKYFAQYIELSNKAAKLNGFKNAGQMWRSEYETSTLYDDLNDLWNEIRPLYNEIHKYVIKKLRNIYKGQIDFDDGLIPAHILGDVWTEDWSHLYPILKPFPKSQSLNITRELIDADYRRIDMFRTANSFYTSIGLLTNEMAYDSNALIEEPSDRRVDCEPETFDFCDGRHYRLKMCSNITRADYMQIHAQLAPIQYYQQYKHQPYAFRTYANPAFARAIGGAISLSAAAPIYLAKIGLANDYRNTYGAAINRLMEMALEDVVSLPYNLLADRWRWDIFGDNGQLNWNAQWWRYKEYYQKVKPPIQRNNDKFDPSAQYYLNIHSVDNFLATILQYQIFKALCVKSGDYNPKEKTPALNRCDFSHSRQVGNVLRSALSIGKSKHWKEVLKIITGEDNFNASALLEFFEPLYNYLKNNNDIQKETNKKSKKNKIKKKQTRERIFANESLDFDEDDFEVDDEDFHDTTEEKNTLKYQQNVTDLINNTETSSILHEFLNITANINTIQSSTEDFTRVEVEDTSETTSSSEEEIEDSSTSTIERKGIEISTTMLKNASTEEMSSSGTEELSSSSTGGSGVKYSIDFVYRGNLSTDLVEFVTFAEVDRNITTSFVENRGLNNRIDFSLCLLFLLLLFFV